MGRKKKTPVEEVVEEVVAEEEQDSIFSDEDLDEIRELAGEGNSLEEIAALIGVDGLTLKKNPDSARAVELGAIDMKCNLRHWQMQAAQSGNVTMLVWLGKVILGQREETETPAQKLQREDDDLTKSLTNLAKEMDEEHGK